MTKQLIIGTVMLAAGIGVAATAGKTIQELRARRAELEKTIATATVELREVKPAIAKLGKVDALPANYVEESKDKLSALQYEQAKKMRFGKLAVAHPGDQTWYDGVWLQATGASGDQKLTARCRVLGRDANSSWRVVETDGPLLSTRPGLGKVEGPPLGNGWRRFLGKRNPHNVHLLVRIGGVPIYETLWRAEKKPLAPNGVPWWRDESLTCGWTINRGYWANVTGPIGKTSAVKGRNGIGSGRVVIVGRGAAGKTIHELRARRAELEKAVATATAELRKVSAAIAKLGKVGALPANYVEESKDRLRASQYEAVKGMKFGVAVGGPRNRAWHQGVYVRAAGPVAVSGLTAHCRFLVMDANAVYRVLETDSDIKASKGLPNPIAHNRVSSAWLGPLRGRPIINAHAIVSIGGIPIYESLWKAERKPISPNGIPWWRDDLLTGRLPLNRTLQRMFH